jgi:Cleft lip and palate transmembrane protein 1 (CLPTM1)
LTIPLPRQTRNNGSLYLYAFATPEPRTEMEKKNWEQSINGHNTMSAYFQLTEYLVPQAETFNLLKNSKETKVINNHITRQDYNVIFHVGRRQRKVRQNEERKG